MTFSRRDIIKSTLVAGSAVTLPASSYGRLSGTNDQIRCAVIGLNGRGQAHIDELAKNVVALCDCDQNVLDQRSTGLDVKKFVDYRKLLDDSSIDAVAIATPNHQHSIMAIRALMAGKHVYVEKPVSHNVWEGRQLVEAQKRFGRVVQCGTQSRSHSGLQAAVDHVRSGQIGRIKYAIGTCFKPRKSIGLLDTPLSIPKHIDYDLWCGPAEKRPLMRPKLHYDWHWDFNTGNGDMGNQGIHQMDVARWFLGHNTISPRVISIGARLGYQDAGNTPNTQTVLHDYPEAPLIFETRGLPKAAKFRNSSNPKDWARNMDLYRNSRIGVVVQCEKGHVQISSDATARLFDLEGREIKTWSGSGNHFKNFLDAVESNDQTLLNAPILEGHLSSALCHTGGVSHQLGRPTHLDEILSAIQSCPPQFQESLNRLVKHLESNGIDATDGTKLTMGADLRFDPVAESVKSHESANQRMTREYRKDFVVPEIRTSVTS